MVLFSDSKALTISPSSKTKPQQEQQQQQKRRKKRKKRCFFLLFLLQGVSLIVAWFHGLNREIRIRCDRQTDFVGYLWNVAVSSEIFATLGDEKHEHRSGPKKKKKRKRKKKKNWDEIDSYVGLAFASLAAGV
jgi:hypothetical protein